MIENYWDADEKPKKQAEEEFPYFERLLEDDESYSQLKKLQKEKCLPKFLPPGKSESDILPELGFRMLEYHLPPLVRMRAMHLIFSIDRDGTSMYTFYNIVSQDTNQETIMLI